MLKFFAINAGLAIIGLGLLTGCGEFPDTGFPGWEHSGFLIGSIPGANSATVYAAATEELRDRFNFPIANSNAGEGTIDCLPAYLSRGDTTSTRDLHLLSTKSDLRRVVRVRVGQDGSAVRLEVGATLQRLDTAPIRSLSMRDPGEGPKDTPVATEGVSTREHNEVWTVIGRDNTLENEIMTAIENHFKPQSPTTGPGE